MSRFTRVAPIIPDQNPLFLRLWNERGYERVSEDKLEDFLAAPGLKALILGEDPNVMKETMDIVVIGPELVDLFGSAMARKGMVEPIQGRAVAARWGVRKLPAVALFRDGTFLGASQGLKSWEEYVNELAEIVQRTPEEAPKRTISILAPKSAD